jgi:hypothetical protein
MAFGEEKASRKTGIERRRKKTIFAFVPFCVFANIG